MNNAKPLFLLAIGALVLCLTTCKKDIAPEPCNDPLDPNCINYHPCNGVQPVTADFDMWYNIPEYAKDYKKKRQLSLDSVYPPGTFYFEAVLNNASYKWKIRNYTPVGNLKDWNYWLMNEWNPPNSPKDTSAYGVHDCILTVTKEVNKACFPNDVSTVTTKKTITIIRPSQLLTSGKFRVLFDGYADSNTITILTWTHVDEKNAIEFDSESPEYRVFVGFKDTKADSIVVGQYFYNNLFLNKLIYFDYEEEWPYVPFNGIFKVDPINSTIEGNYEIRNKQNVFVKHKFKGRKL